MSVEWVFGALLGVLVLSALAVRRARTRGQLWVAGLAPLAAFVVYEAVVQQVMPRADVRIDWLLLFPILIVHASHAVARGRRLGAGAGD